MLLLQRRDVKLGLGCSVADLVDGQLQAADLRSVEGMGSHGKQRAAHAGVGMGVGVGSSVLT